MKAMILAAGHGVRLGDLTAETPKPMLDLCGRPILEYIIRNLAQQGFNQIVINICFRPFVIPSCIGTGRQFGVEITYSHELELLGTAGGVKKMGFFFDELFLIHYGDIVTNQDFRPMLQFHRERNALATLLVHQYAHAHSSIEVDDEWRITSFVERPSRRIEDSWDNSCVHICDLQILDEISVGMECDLAKDVWPRLVSTGRLFAFPVSGYYCAVDSPAQLAEARLAVEGGEL